MGRWKALIALGTAQFLMVLDTSVAPQLWVLVLGWSIIEGLGAALVLPALAALVAGNYAGRDRAIAYGVIGGRAGAGRPRGDRNCVMGVGDWRGMP